jgi:hypothetical protein
MPAPDAPYQLQPCTGQSLENLVMRQIRFLRPAAFNDLFDCAIRVDGGAISNDDYQRLYNRAAVKQGAVDHRFLTAFDG